MHTYLAGLIGGILIGLAAAVFLIVNGRIMGASGILGGVIDGSDAGARRTEKLWFLGGLVLVPGAAVVLGGVPADTHLTPDVAVVVAAGLLVGIGTRLANGCTSGHGVCGLSRLNPRGMGATILYLLAGGVSVLVFRHILGVI